MSIFFRDIQNISSWSSHRRCSIKIGVLKNFPTFAGKCICAGVSFNKVAGLQLKKGLQHRCFPVNFYEIFKNSCFYRTLLVAASEAFRSKFSLKMCNPFNTTSLYLYPLKTSETRRFLLLSGRIEKEKLHKIVNREGKL